MLRLLQHRGRVRRRFLHLGIPKHRQADRQPAGVDHLALLHLRVEIELDQLDREILILRRCGDGPGIRAVDRRCSRRAGRQQRAAELADYLRVRGILRRFPHEGPVHHHGRVAGEQHVGGVVDADIRQRSRIGIGHQVDHRLQAGHAGLAVEGRHPVFAIELAAGLLQEAHPVGSDAPDAIGRAVIERPAIAAVARQFLGGGLQLVPGLRRLLETGRRQLLGVVEQRQQREREHHAVLLAVPGDSGEARGREVRDEVGRQLVGQRHRELREFRHPAGVVSFRSLAAEKAPAMPPRRT